MSIWTARKRRENPRRARPEHNCYASRCVSIDGARLLVTTKGREGISMKYLEQLARPLVKSGLLKSVRGKGGGYVLAEPSAAIRAGDILRAAEGNILPVSSCDGVTFDCARIADCASVKFWIGLDRVIEDYVDGVMLKDIIDEGDVFFDVDKISQIVAAKLLEEDAE